MTQEAVLLPLEEAKPVEVRAMPAPALPFGARGSRRWCGTFLGAGLLFAGVQAWVVQGYQVCGNCMEPNLRTGERLLGSKLARFEQIQRGDVVVFRPPHRPDTTFIKRVVGLPGEVLEIRSNRVYVNNRRLDEPYLRREWHDDRPPERIPPEMVYVMGDNRDDSNDSRVWGQLPIHNIQAKAWIRYWPPGRIERIR